MKRILLFFIIIIFLTPTIINAATIGLVPCGNKGQDPCTLQYLFVMLQNIYIFFLIPNDAINQKIPIIPVIAALMLVWAGFMYISGTFLSGGSGHVQTSHDIFKYVIWGLIIIYGAHVFISFFLKIIGASIAPTWPTI